jgi:hypothetical protein
MVKVGFHPAAVAELRGAARYYEDRVLGLGAEFAAEVERVCARVQTGHVPCTIGPRADIRKWQRCGGV